MGTNFYIAGHQDDDLPEWHIGKRSAAGMFCWNCSKTLCKEGIAGIHKGDRSSNISENPRKRWHSVCPLCGAAPVVESVATSAVGRELGWNKQPPKRKRGVATCSSFTWAMHRDDLEAKIKKWRFWPWKIVIVDEYGHRFTAKQFAEVLSECPVQYTQMIGHEFS